MVHLDFPALFALAIALAVGLIIGMERGWKEREAAEGSRVAGLRTFGLIGLIGGLAGALARELGASILAGGMVGITALAAIGYWADRQAGDQDASLTSAIAMLVTFGLGALAGIGQPENAAALAVMAALLLGLKPTLHATLRAMSRHDLLAALQLLLVSLVVLPLLPDRGFGPGEVLNPYRLWWIVVLVAGSGFAGYVVVRLVGHQRGLVALGFFGGLASSTAVSLTLARAVGTLPALVGAATSGIMAATTVMVARLAVISTLLAPALLPRLAAPALAAIVAGVAATLLALRRSAEPADGSAIGLVNPFELRVAVQYAALVAVVLLLSRLLLDRVGAIGLYGIAALGGLVDVDAPVVSAATLAADGLPAHEALIAIALAILANSAFKLGLALSYGGARLALLVGAGYGAMAAAAGLAALVFG